MKHSFAALMALSAVLVFSSVASAGLTPAEAGDPLVPDLIYDSMTGEVLMDIDGAVGFTGYVLNSASAFNDGNHTPFMGGVVTSLSYELAEATFGTPAAPYPKSIGLVFPSGLNLAGLSALLTGNQVSRGNNEPIVAFDLVVINEEVVPEPATIAMGLMGLVGLGLYGWRRRSC